MLHNELIEKTRRMPCPCLWKLVKRARRMKKVIANQFKAKLGEMDVKIVQLKVEFDVDFDQFSETHQFRPVSIK